MRLRIQSRDNQNENATQVAPQTFTELQWNDNKADNFVLSSGSKGMQTRVDWGFADLLIMNYSS